MTKSRNLLGATALGVGLMFGFGAPQEAGAATWTPNPQINTPAASYVFGNNDPFPAPLLSSPALAKCDWGDACSWSDAAENQGGAPGNYASAFTVTVDTFKGAEPSTLEPVAGTWSFSPVAVNGADPVLYPKWAAVKADGGYVVFEIPVGQLSGNWRTPYSGEKFTADDGEISCGPDGRNCGLSHIAFYDTQYTVVPVPAALPLLLTALGALGVIGRKKIMAA